MLGDGVFTVTLAIEALRVDHNASGLAYVLAARIVPTVMFVLVSGEVVDRVPRRLAMLASDALRGAAVAAIAVLVASGAGSLGALVVMAVVFGVADVHSTSRHRRQSPPSWSPASYSPERAPSMRRAPTWP